MKVRSFVFKVGFCLIVFSFVSSCRQIEKLLGIEEEPEEFYQQANPFLFTARSSYPNMDSLSMSTYLFCAETGEDGGKEHAILKRDSYQTVSSVQRAFKKTGLPIQFDQNMLELDSNKYCELTNPEHLNRYLMDLINAGDDQKNHSSLNAPRLIAAIHYGAYWSPEIKADAPGKVYTGNTYCRITRTMASAVVEQDTIAYLNAYFHRDTVVVNEPEALEYKLSPEVWDSLAVLTMRDFKERLN